eukprot:1049150_1
MDVVLLLPIIYFSIYFLLFFAASIICAQEANLEYKKEKEKRKEARTAKEQTKPDDTNVIDVHQEMETKTKDIGCKWYLTRWATLVYEKKKVYLQIIPHLFDQATDFMVIMQYYQYKQDKTFTSINTNALFYLAISILIVHRVISCFGVYVLTHNLWNVTLQLFDVLLIRCVYINYKFNSTEPTNMQRYLCILEGAFEAMPQLLLSTVFLTKTGDFSEIIVISLVSSIWTLTGQVAGDDKGVFKKEWRSFEFEYKKWPILNIRCVLRVLARFLEIGSRLSLLVLLWVNIGGFGTSIILSFELFVLVIICYGYKSFGCIGNLMYFVEDDGKIHKFNWTDGLLIAFMGYKLLSQYIYLALITVFATVHFEAYFVEPFDLRHEITFDYPFGFSLFVFCWISSVLFPLIGTYCVRKGTFAGKFNSWKLSTSRHIDHLYRMHWFNDIFEMLAMGKTIEPLDIEYLTKLQTANQREMKWSLMKRSNSVPKSSCKELMPKSRRRMINHDITVQLYIIILLYF